MKVNCGQFEVELKLSMEICLKKVSLMYENM